MWLKGPSAVMPASISRTSQLIADCIAYRLQRPSVSDFAIPLCSSTIAEVDILVDGLPCSSAASNVWV
jgi:hypothetical protein